MLSGTLPAVSLGELALQYWSPDMNDMNNKSYGIIDPNSIQAPHPGLIDLGGSANSNGPVGIEMSGNSGQPDPVITGDSNHPDRPNKLTADAAMVIGACLTDLLNDDYEAALDKMFGIAQSDIDGAVATLCSMVSMGMAAAANQYIAESLLDQQRDQKIRDRMEDAVASQYS